MSDKYADIPLVQNQDKRRFEMEVENHIAFIEYIINKDRKTNKAKNTKN